MPNKVMCRACKTYIDREEAICIGLGYVCNEDCLRTIRTRSNKPKKRANCIPPDVRKQVRTRDKNRCRFCGSIKMTQLHHVRYRSEGGPHIETNLITLCREHHEMVHSTKRYWQPLLISLLEEQYSTGRFRSVVEFEKTWDPDSVLYVSKAE